MPALGATPVPPSAKVEKLLGSALFNGKKIRESESLVVNGHLQTAKRSYLRIRMDIWNSSIVIGPETQMDLDLTSPKAASPKRYQLREGVCRWISAMIGDQLKGSHVYTKSASMGVRGTDFEIRNSDKTGETEVIVFDGQVLLKSNLGNSEKLITKGHWGGVGGRYGNVVKTRSISPAEEEEALARAGGLTVEKQSSSNSSNDY